MPVPCPDCRGSGISVANHVRYADGKGAVNVPLHCSRCEGSGRVPDEMFPWIEAGRRMRARRLKANRTLRAEAARRGMLPSELSMMECGKIKPIDDANHETDT